ncbi:MAG: HEAT repeat domain-containing protein [Deltaproteobacteria bacterium]|nr:HEAT repeat domain-containing protein [Deltaproteobacteria bacterium]MCB9787565.1 HEAT repeat domain-containing protein [Deltaproteobacteria bacterium]
MSEAGGRRGLWIAVAGVAALVVLWLIFGRNHEAAVTAAAPAPAQGSTSDEAPGTSADAEPRSLLCRFEVGDALAYDVHLEVRSKFNGQAVDVPGMPGQASPSQSYTLGYRSRLELRVLEEGEDGWLVAARIENNEQSLNSQVASSMGEGYELPFLFRMDSRCMLQGIGLSKSVDEQTRMAHQNILLLAEGVMPADPSANKWTEEQLDDTGIYQATYTVVGPAAERAQAPMPPDVPTQVLKVRDFYKDVRPIIDTAKATVKILGSRDEFSFAPSGKWLSQAQVHLQLEYVVADKPLVSKQIDLGLQRTESAGGDAWAKAISRSDYRFWDRMQLTAGGLEPPPAVRKGRAYDDVPPIPGLGERSMASVLDEFRRLVQSGEGRSIYRAQIMLLQYLRLHPEAAKLLLAELKTGTMTETERAHAFLGLEMAGTKEAREVLETALADTEMSWADRARAVAALSDIPEPDVAVVQTLTDAARWEGTPIDAHDQRELQNTALLSLGHLADTARAEHPDLSEMVRLELSNRFESTADPNALAAVVGAAGNAKDPALWPEVKDQLSHESPHVREMAANAAVKIGAPDVWVSLLDQLQNETDSRVRSKIVYSLIEAGSVPANAVSTLGQLLASEEHVDVRLMLVRLLGQSAATNPDAMAILVARLESETSPPVMVELGKYVDATKHL